MQIRLAVPKDIEKLCQYDQHIRKQELEHSIRLNRVYMIVEGKLLLGWLRYGLFWDNTPFLNLLYLLENNRGKGIGRQAVEYWEQAMKEQGYDTVLTSTRADEYAQHFYTKLGYKTIGGFLMEEEPFEMILEKRL